MKAHSPIQNHTAIIWALVSRNFKTQAQKGTFAFVWLIVEPVFHLLTWIAILTLRHHQTILGFTIPLFIVTGIYPYFIFKKSIQNSLTVVRSNQSLSYYKQIQPIDSILAGLIFEVANFFVLFTASLFALKYIGYEVALFKPLLLIINCIILIVLSFGLALACSVIGFVLPESKLAISILMRFLYLISGVFFSIGNIPAQFQPYLLWNPLLQIIEMIRYSFSPLPIPNNLSLPYLFIFSVLSLWIGLSIYYHYRHKLKIL